MDTVRKTLKNPHVARFDNGFCIRFVRNNYKVLVWAQDITSKKMKSTLVNLPAVCFHTKAEAEEEVRDIVIPYLMKEKGVESKEIFGW